MAPYTRSMHHLIQCRDWSNLEEGILDLILQKLPHPDCLNFGKVCRRWLSVFHDRCALSFPPPCILLGTTPGGITLHRGIIHGGRILRIFSPMPTLLAFHRIVGSGFGWLVIACLFTSDIYLLNPISEERLPLPSLDSYFICHVDLSSNPGSGHYFLVARTLYKPGQIHCLAWWRPGDQGWTIVYIQQLLKQCVDSVIHVGKLYVVCNDGRLLVCAFNPQTRITENWIYSFQSIKDMQFKRLVSSNAELFLVMRQGVGSQMHVFRNREEQDGQWVRMESLGDLVLFIGMHGAESLCAKDLMGSTYESNSIYCLTFNQSLQKYSLTDKRTENIRVGEHSLEWVGTKTW